MNYDVTKSISHPESSKSYDSWRHEGGTQVASEPHERWNEGKTARRKQTILIPSGAHKKKNLVATHLKRMG